jgi:outer membrane lipoprotein-sorting protein
MTALLLAALLAGPVGDAEAVLASLEEAGRDLTTMQASFVETRVLVLLEETTEQEGMVFLQVPGRFRWDYSAPQPSVTLIRDGAFARYFPRTKQVFRGAAKGEADLLVGFGPGAANLGKKYRVELLPDESIDGRATHVLDLTPRAEQASSGLFSSIRMWVDQARFIPIQTRLTEPTGDHTTVRFQDVEVNGRLPKGAFDLDLPRDVVEVE